MNDEKYILRCLELAQHGAYYVAPNPMVGAVLVDANGRILAEGWHQHYGGPHAEVNCLSSIPESTSLADCTLYVNLEPCCHWGKTPPCTDLIIRRGISRVVVGCQDPNPKVGGQGVQILRNAGIEVVVGVAQDACRELNKRFLCLIEKQRPYVLLKWAQTADGYIDKQRQGGDSMRISTPLIKRLVHQQRAENMAIMVGTNTVILDNPKLLNTHWSGRHPIRVTMDTHQRISPSAHILSPDAPTIIYTHNETWQQMLQDMASRGIHSVLVEGGAKWLNTIIQSGIYDEIHVEISNQRLGDTPGIKAPEIHLDSTPIKIENHRIYYKRFA